MRKLKLQIQISLDGFVARPNGEGDWIWLNGIKDEIFSRRIIELADSCDTILLGRNMLPVFTSYWEDVVDNKPGSPDFALAQRMVNMRKIVFSHTQTDFEGRNLEVENGDLATVVRALKQEQGKDIMVYGGANFVSALISLNLIDEYYLISVPVAIGEGMPIFKEQKLLKLESTTPYKNGKVINKYLPV